jgi:hypothetical protein
MLVEPVKFSGRWHGEALLPCEPRENQQSVQSLSSYPCTLACISLSEDIDSNVLNSSTPVDRTNPKSTASVAHGF